MEGYTYWATDNSFYQFEKSELSDSINLEDWLSMNASLGLVRIDSRYAQIYESKRLRFGNYKLYEMRHLSPVRTNSVRFLMSDTKDSVLVLEMANGPIYQLWENLIGGNPENTRLLLHPDPSMREEEILLDYIKFFFGNVAGKHGPFHIVQNLDNVKNRANNHYNLNPQDRPSSSPYTHEEWSLALQKCILLYQNHTVVEIKDSEDPDSDKISGYQLQGLLVVFRTGLFRVNISISTDPKKYGQVALSDEILGRMVPDPDHSGEYIISFEPYLEDEQDDDTNSSDLPEFPYESNRRID